MNAADALQGHERVAALLLSLPSEAARAILQTMREDVVTKVAAAMTQLDPRLSDEKMLSGLYRDLARAIHGPKRLRPCTPDELGKLLNEALGNERGQAVLRAIAEERRRERPFAVLESQPPAKVVALLKGESNAVCALVLSNMGAAHAAAILRAFEPEAARDIVCRMATLEGRNPSLLQTIGEDLSRELESLPAVGRADPGVRLKAVAELLNNCPPDMEKSVLESVAEKNADMAHELREYMFTWEDIAGIDKRIMQKILGTVDTKTLSIALKACNAGVEQNVLGNLSSRAREMVLEERELAGALPLSEVTAARDTILKTIRAMIETGEFRPHRGGEELVA